MKEYKQKTSHLMKGEGQPKQKMVLTALSAVMSLLVISSVAQATDLQIYAKPEAGKKTIVLMLDTSGSMAEYDNDSCIYYDYYNRAYYYGTGTESATTAVPYERSYCKNSSGVKVAYSRLTRLKDGMFALLDNTTDPNLPSASIGLGHFSVNGDGRSAKILVPASTLGKKGSTQREALKTAIKNLTASGGTPSAHAYAEAAAYMLGTSTLSPVEIFKLIYKKVTTSSQVVDYYYCDRTNRPYLNSATGVCYENANFTGRTRDAVAVYKTVYADNFYQCKSWASTDFNNQVQYCNGMTGTSTSYWNNLGTMPPSDLANYTAATYDSSTIRYYSKENQLYSNADSGFSSSVSSSKTADGTSYSSPLPTKKVSCDGNGIYFLSDGEANSSSTSRAQTLMRTALNDNSFECPTDGLKNLVTGTDRSGNANDWSAWHCMGELAKRLYSGNNPQKAEIRTAFVGFGSDFSGLSAPHVQQACQLSSRTQDDRKGDDACSPTQATPYRLTKPGYGNGLYYEASSSSQVQASVLEFLRTFDNPLDPLPTGAISVPVDALNPNGYQPYGYLRTFAPNPRSNTMVWAGNLKKYNVGNMGALTDLKNALIYNDKGDFTTTTYDLWNSTNVADGKVIDQGGAYWNLPMPTEAVAAVAEKVVNGVTVRAIPAILAAPNALRNLFTDVSSVSSGVLQSSSSGSLLEIPSKTSSSVTNGAYVLDSFAKQDILKDFPNDLKVKLVNYLGYDLPLSTTTTLPTILAVPSKPFITMGGSIHSIPVQLTYEGVLDSNGDLTSTRKQSVLYGSMEGGLHVLNAATGVEQMVFVPSEILKDANASKALRGIDQAGDLSYGVGGAWVADAAYNFRQGSSDDKLYVTANQMNVYGGMRMGGKSYYGLDLLNPTSPKLLFRVGADQTSFSRMGQSWSKPVLTNIRYNGVIKRVMIVGGGYDMCYENPQFKLGATNSNTDYPNTACDGKTQADGNAVYIIDAKTGKRLWWASNTGADSNDSNMVHSIVSRISTLDRDGDGLVDHLYFGDLGGQVFRADLNNLAGTSASGFGKRVVRLVNLGTTSTGSSITNGNQPRFYQPPTLTKHSNGGSSFILVGIASGDRSTPLDVSPDKGREGMLPAAILTGRLTNKVYGVIDRDFIKNNLITGAPTLKTKDLTLANLQVNPQTQSGDITSLFSASGKQGWYRSLSSNYSGVEVTGRTAGGIKAFEEEPIALKNNLFIPVYDPEGTGVEPLDSCSTRIIGESNRQQYCLPFGVCLNADGSKNLDQEQKTGLIITNGKNQNVIGSGIRGITLGPDTGGSGTETKNSCGSLTLIGNIQGSGKWKCSRILNPVRWYEKYVSSN